MENLDGLTYMRNMLDILLEIDQIKTIQFAPGAGQAPTYSEEYIPQYQRILVSGKNLFLLVEPKWQWGAGYLGGLTIC